MASNSFYETIIVIGNPAEEIVKSEHEHGVDLVVMATHGRSGISHLILGSVAEHVVRESVCAVGLTQQFRGLPSGFPLHQASPCAYQHGSSVHH
jgi:hypothetical protein